MRPGLYEELLTRQIEQMLEATPQLDREIAGVDDAEQPHVLALLALHLLGALGLLGLRLRLVIGDLGGALAALDRLLLRLVGALEQRARRQDVAIGGAERSARE